MAEALGIAGSIVGIAGLTGQIVQGLCFLNDFFGALKDASDDLRVLGTEIAILRPLAERLRNNAQQYVRIHPDVEAAKEEIAREVEPGLNYCADCISSLTEEVRKYQQKADHEKSTVWKVRFAISSKQFAKYIERLERSKSYLVFIQTLLSSSIQQLHYQLNEDTRASLHEAVSEVTRSGHNDEGKETTLQTRSISKSVPQVSEEVVAGLDGLQPLLMAAVQSAIADVLDQQKNDGNKLQSKLGRSPSVPPTIDENPVTIIASSSINENSICTFSERTIGLGFNSGSQRIDYDGKGVEPRGRGRIVKTYTTWRQVKFWFGTSYLHGTRRTVQTRGSKFKELVILEETSQTDVKLIPVSWLLTKGALATMSWTTKNFQRPVISLGLQIFNIVPKNSPIIEACKNSDLATIRLLFQEKQASPHDRDADGFILTDWAIYSMLERISSWEKPWIKELRACFGVCRFLIETCGIDPSQTQCLQKWNLQYRDTAWADLVLFQIRNRGHEHARAAAFWFQKILRLLIYKSVTNPFAHANESLTDVLELQTRHLDDEVVEASFSLLVGQELWSIEWDEFPRGATTPEYLWVDRPVDFVKVRMTSAITTVLETAACGFRDPGETGKFLRAWPVMLEKILDTGLESIMNKLVANLINAYMMFALLHPHKDVQRRYQDSVSNLMIAMFQYASKLKSIEHRNRWSFEMKDNTLVFDSSTALEDISASLEQCSGQLLIGTRRIRGHVIPILSSIG